MKRLVKWALTGITSLVLVVNPNPAAAQDEVGGGTSKIGRTVDILLLASLAVELGSHPAVQRAFLSLRHVGCLAVTGHRCKSHTPVPEQPQFIWIPAAPEGDQDESVPLFNEGQVSI
jgi:hypothetical protein